jgi:hypothetical protein
MRVCGVDIQGGKANLVVLDGSRNEFTHVRTGQPYIDIKDDRQAPDIRWFFTTISDFFREHAVELIGIKSRRDRGKFAGGATGFKLEALIQMYNECGVVLIAPTSIAAAIKKHNPRKPIPVYAYQTAAFETAFAILE